MLQTVYADVLFIINFCMDYLALYITSKFLKVKLRPVKAGVSATLGALYSVFTVILRLNNLLFTFLFGYIMCIMAYGIKKGKDGVRTFIAFISVNFLLGGGMTVVFSFFNTAVGERLIMIYGDIVTVPEKLPINVFALGVFITVTIFGLLGRILAKKGISRRLNAEITVNGKSERFILTEDSGNTLTEPLSGDQVIFLSEDAMLRLLGKPTYNAIKDLEPIQMKNSGLKIRLAIYETVAKKEMCACVRPNRILIEGREIRAWIACAKRASFGEFDGISPPINIC